MQTANVMVALGGDKGTTVPKYGVTISEIAVLQAIHGNDSVFDIEPTGDVERSSREEIARLHDTYSRPSVNGKPEGAVADLFPGIAARAFRNWDEIEIDAEFFKPLSRAAAPVAEPEAEKPAKPAKRGKKAAAEPVADADADESEDAPEDGKLFG